jgi:hypothetical protein
LLHCRAPFLWGSYHLNRHIYLCSSHQHLLALSYYSLQLKYIKIINTFLYKLIKYSLFFCFVITSSTFQCAHLTLWATKLIVSLFLAQVIVDVVMCSLHNIQEKNAYRTVHVCVHMFQLENLWEDFDDILNACYTTESHPKCVLLQFLQQVTTTWWTHNCELRATTVPLLKCGNHSNNSSHGSGSNHTCKDS